MCTSDTADKRGYRGLCIQRQPFSDERVTLFSVERELDHGSFDVLETAIHTTLEGGCARLVLDMSRITDIFPSGIYGVIKGLSEIHDCGGALVLMNPHPAVKEVLKTLQALGLTGPIKSVASVEEATCIFSEPPLCNAPAPQT